MIINQNFGIATHILLFLSDCNNNYITSTELAESINTNPVVVRRILKQLSLNGLVETKQGKFGSKLAKQPNEISLLDVYNIFYSGNVLELIHYPNKSCPKGPKIVSTVNNMLEEATLKYKEQLELITLQKIKERL